MLDSLLPWLEEIGEVGDAERVGVGIIVGYGSLLAIGPVFASVLKISGGVVVTT